MCIRKAGERSHELDIRLQKRELLFCYVAYTQTRRTRDPYEKIGFGEDRKPYENIWRLKILPVSL